MEQRAYWNRVSDVKQFTTPFQLEEFSRHAGKEAKILDVGCGYGRTLAELYRHGYTHLTGIDFSEGMIRRGRTLYPQLDLRVKADASVPFPDGTFDAVILFAVLTCIVDDREQAALIAEIHRVLKPGGILYVNDFLLNTDERNVTRYREYADTFGVYGAFALPEGAVLRHHSEAHIRRLLAEFSPLAFRPLTFTTMNGHTSNGFYYLGAR